MLVYHIYHGLIILLSGKKDVDTSIRLVDGGDNDGINTTIELKFRGEWRSVCDTFWSQQDAVVACRQLGSLHPDSKCV